MRKLKYYFRQYRGYLLALLLIILGIANNSGFLIFWGVLTACYYGIRSTKKEYYDCLEYEYYDIIEGLEQLNATRKGKVFLHEDRVNINNDHELPITRIISTEYKLEKDYVLPKYGRITKSQFKYTLTINYVSNSGSPNTITFIGFSINDRFYNISRLINEKIGYRPEGKETSPPTRGVL